MVMTSQTISYSEREDIVYIRLSDQYVVSTECIDDLHIVDYDADGNVVGVELIGASGGLDLRGLPERERLEAAAKYMTFPVFV
jgi:uncharacterized protein YuzE